MKSDVDLAIWLTESLAAFVKAELKRYMWANGYQSLQGNQRHLITNSFVIGCCHRISQRLMELTNKRKVTVMSKSLVVCKQALINDAISNLRIRNPDNRGRKNKLVAQAYVDGQSSGNSASFGRPVEAGGQLRLK